MDDAAATDVLTGHSGGRGPAMPPAQAAAEAPQIAKVFGLRRPALKTDDRSAMPSSSCTKKSNASGGDRGVIQNNTGACLLNTNNLTSGGAGSCGSNTILCFERFDGDHALEGIYNQLVVDEDLGGGGCESDILVLLAGLSQQRAVNGSTFFIQDLLGLLGGQCGNSSRIPTGCGGDGNGSSESDLHNLREFVDSDSIEEASADCQNGLPDLADWCIIGCIICMVVLLRAYCGANDQKHRSRPASYIPGRHALGTSPAAASFTPCKGRRQCWALAGFRKALRKWRRKSWSARQERTDQVLGAMLLVVLLFQPVANAAGAVVANRLTSSEDARVQNETISSQVIAAANQQIDINELAALDINPALRQFIGTMVVQMNQLKQDKEALEDKTQVIETALVKEKYDTQILENKTQVIETALLKEKQQNLLRCSRQRCTNFQT